MRSLLNIPRVVTISVMAFASGAGIGAQPAIPVRSLATVDAKSVEHFGTILSVREIANGKLLVNDAGNRQILLLDSRLAGVNVVIDSAARVGQSYGPFATTMIPYLGDSTLFVDGASLALVLITPAGSLGRVLSAPAPSDFKFLTFSTGGIDANGNLLYRSIEGRVLPDSKDAVNFMAAASKFLDSLPIVRANFATRKIDTIARLKASDYAKTVVVQRPGGIDLIPLLNPLPTFDEWAVLSDGSIAIVRAQDYRVDIVNANSRVVSSSKLPFDWRRVTESEKLALIDSLRRAREAKQASLRAQRGLPATSTAKPPASTTVKQLASTISTDGQSAAPDLRPVIGRDETIVQPSEIVDYYPPIRAGAAQADRDANLWILPATSAQSAGGELIYDVVNNKAELIERVRVPLGRSIAGFGKNGVVYLTGKDNLGWFLERARVVH